MADGLLQRFRNSALGERCVSAVRGTIDGCVERYLRIDTHGPTLTKGAGHFQDSNGYEPLDYPLLRRCVRAMDLRPDDVVVEIGCGMGRALALIARQPVRKCVGIELSAELADRARTNVSRLRGRRAPVAVLTADAVFADYDEGTSFYLFNSFGETTLRAVLGRLAESLAARPRAIRIAYVNPIHLDVFESTRWLRRGPDVGSRLFRMRSTNWYHDPVADAAPLREAVEGRLVAETARAGG